MALETKHADMQRFVQRERRLQFWTWFSLAVPLTLFIILVVLVGREAQTYSELKGKNADLAKKNDDLNRRIEENENKLKVNNFALTAVKAQRQGPAPTVMYFRIGEKPVLAQALGQLGFNVIENSEQANPKLKGKEADTLIYGCQVSQEDLRIIAAALIKAGISIRRIAPAQKRPEPNLVQLVASPRTDPSQRPIDPAAWTKTGPCPARDMPPTPAK